MSEDPQNVAQPSEEISKMPFEAAMAELERIVERLERGKVTLEDSIRLYERGEVLRQRCDHLLKDAEMRIEKITLDTQGAPTGLTPFEAAKEPTRP